MSKVLGMLVALAIFAALPAAAFAQGTSPSGGGGTTSSGNVQDGDIEQSASAGNGGNAGNQAAIVQQNAGRDANAAVNQSQNFSTGGVDRDHGRVHGHGHGHDNDVDNVGVGGGGVGGGVTSVTLARTGFDAWVLALIGGAALAGGLGLLAVQRRGGLSS
jgi:LPXTG-motif cell wall-anchored protein